VLYICHLNAAIRKTYGHLFVFMASIDWELYSWVMRGKQRRLVVKALNKQRIPTEIKDETKLSLTHVSKVLKAFKEKKLVICLTPAAKRGKVYQLTTVGKQIRDAMVKEE